MKEKTKLYIDKLTSYLPVAIFIFTIVFVIGMFPYIEDLKTDFGINAINELVDVYTFYLLRTILLVLFIPLYDTVLVSIKLSYKLSTMIHFILVMSTVGLLFYKPGSPSQALFIIVGMCIVIYVIIRIVTQIKEKQFIENANEIFKKNKE